ncbi:para-nitrobenzyl esterase [Cucurbitaria berberidis CBS 394.84]|uniref:Para-nitrobenzyl esterase n=1 Tax=Cucurbitaria berberidis CBS 394.84 TaxID=1168544 RepID=A0A9P4G7M9_9PLEO|nr:para-nitrobenzyl esterase [Cucurbitaria berberidis CBS 394.84]KAF1840542.1 para-nitrobenzyl esterase [Cucurbitaria berberidis CBS 394.84]
MPLCSDVLVHPSLKCALRGKPSASAVQFRNLKYASIPARYKDSIPFESLEVDSSGVFDATYFGPSCPQLRGAQAWDLTLVGVITLPCEQGQGKTENMDEFECLNLTVTVPTSPTASKRKGRNELPVFVWVHGGGLSMGSNSWPQYDVRRFVDRSSKIGKPIIGVAINYRHGIFGFLASDEIGATGNMGYKDQVLAFRWIKKHIAGFGGDPANVTAVGESAGAISLSTLLCANIGTEGLFERVVLMSGEVTLRKPTNRRWQQQMFEDQAKHLGLDVKDKQGLNIVLLDTEAEALAQKLPLAQHFSGTVDGKWIKEDITIKTVTNGGRVEHKPIWCKEFVTGDAAHDGMVLKARILDHPDALARLKVACKMHLSPSETQRLLAAYNLQNTPSKEEEMDRLREIASELRFYLPSLAAYRGWKATSPPKRASRYHFHVPNPVDGLCKGLASHELDVAYLLQNFNDHFDERNRKIAQEMADHFINFTNGEGWVENGKVIVFTRDGIAKVDEERYDQEYRGGRGTVMEEIGAEKLRHVAETWQGVRKEEHASTRSISKEAKL